MLNKKRGFSFIELSVIFIIVALFIANIIEGLSLVRTARIKGAKILTKASPVHQIEDLILWLEPTLEGSFADSDYVAIEYGSTVYEWKNKVGFKGYLPNAIQVDPAKQPTLIEKGANKLPTLRFDGSTDEMLITFDAFLPSKTEEFTIFVVASTDAPNAFKKLYGWSPKGSIGGTPFLLTYMNKWYLTFGNDATDLQATPAPVALTTTLVTWRFYNNVIYGYINGLPTNPASASIKAPKTQNSTKFVLGAFPAGNSNWDGDISEIIMYERSLPDEEREKIEVYLIQKYKIN